MGNKCKVSITVVAYQKYPEEIAHGNARADIHAEPDIVFGGINWNSLVAALADKALTSAAINCIKDEIAADDAPNPD